MSSLNLRRSSTVNSFLKFYFPIGIISVITLFPVYWLIISSLKSLPELFGIPPTLFPKKLILQAYSVLRENPLILRYILNSLIVTTGTIIVTTPIAVLSAFALSKFSFKGNGFLSSLLFFSQLFPICALLVPLFIIWKKLDLYNTYICLILSYQIFALPLSILLLKGFFDSIPEELMDQAMTDGCSKTGAFFRIILPLSVTGLAAVAIYIFILCWGEFLFALSFTSSNEMRTLQVGIAYFAGEHRVAYQKMMAVSVIGTVPTLAFFFFIQKYFIAGITAGAVKG